MASRLAHEIDGIVDAPHWLSDAQKHWYLYGSGFFMGCVSDGLDNFVVDDERRDIVRRISVAAQKNLLDQGDDISRSYLEKLECLENFRLPLKTEKFADVARRWLVLLDDDRVEEVGEGYARVQRWPPPQLD